MYEYNVYRRRIKTEEKAKGVTAAWGAELIKFLAVLAIWHQDDMKKLKIARGQYGEYDEFIPLFKSSC